MAIFRLVVPMLLPLAACKPPPESWHPMPGADPVAGRALVQRAGCTSCHAFPDIAWPQGAVGPALDGFAEQALIAGRLPNRPEILANYVRNAPGLVPGAAMPAMPISERESRDVAAYLYTLRRH